MKASKEDIKNSIEGYFLLNEAAKETAERWLAIFGGRNEWLTSIEIDCEFEEDIDSSSIEINTEASHCSCCGNDYDSHSIPLSYIWDTEWETREREKIEREKQLKAEIDAKRKAAEEERRKKKRYEDFQKMKKEFE
jgi:predicted RNase H-like nuclease (RuvC/YqgF family)